MPVREDSSSRPHGSVHPEVHQAEVNRCVGAVFAQRRRGLAPCPKGYQRASTQNTTCSRCELRREKVASFDQYPFSLAAVRELDELVLHPAVTFLVGENGSGKSTLLEAIAVAWEFNAEGGTKNFRYHTRASPPLIANICGW